MSNWLEDVNNWLDLEYGENIRISIKRKTETFLEDLRFVKRFLEYLIKLEEEIKDGS